MFKTRAEEEQYRLEMAAMNREAYEAQQAAIAASPFVKLSKLIKSGDRFSHHWEAMKKAHGNIAIRYEVAYHSWGNKRGYVSSVESADGRKWRGTEGRSADGGIKAALKAEK